ncbi:MAG: hypothetical protein HY314_02345 [Acidobacteria bacterium]|nr:hypothetical protein [Acidobacteriota bacterium]
MFNRKTMITLSFVMLFCFIPTAVLPVPNTPLTIKVTSPKSAESFDGTAEDLQAELEQLESRFKSLQGYDASLLRDEGKVIKLAVNQEITLVSEQGGRRLKHQGGQPDLKYSISSDVKTIQFWVAEKSVADVDLSSIQDQNTRHRAAAFLGYLTAEYVVARKLKAPFPYDQARASRINSSGILPTAYAAALWPLIYILGAVVGCLLLREEGEDNCARRCGGQNHVKSFSFSCLTLEWTCECY